MINVLTDEDETRKDIDVALEEVANNNMHLKREQRGNFKENRL